MPNKTFLGDQNITINFDELKTLWKSESYGYVYTLSQHGQQCCKNGRLLFKDLPGYFLSTVPSRADISLQL